MQLFRSLIRVPGFSVTAVLALAIGMGASAAFFAVIDGVLLRPLPYRDQERLVTVDARQASSFTIPSYQQFLDWRESTTSFDGMAYAAGEAFLLRRRESTDAIGVAMTSDGFFEMLGTRALLGRVVHADDHRAATTPVVVLSERLWREAFGGDPDVVGQTLDTDKASFLIIGVMPAGFAFPAWASAWAPLTPLGHLVPGVQRRDWRADARAIGRLKANVSPAVAAADLNAAAARLALEYPATDADIEAILTPVLSQVVGDVRRPLMLFGLAVGVMLVIAWANVGTLILVRASVRSRELAVRSALGATPYRLVRLLMAESAVLSAAGGTLGLVLAYWMLHLLRYAAPAGVPRLDEIALDWRTVAFTLAVAVSAPLVFGLPAALHAARRSTLRLGHESSPGRTDSRIRATLLTAQVALSLVLLAGTGLLLRSFAELRAVDAGFDRERLLSARIQPPAGRYQDPDALLTLYDQVREEVARIPGVERVAIVNHENAAGVRSDIRVPGAPLNPGQEPRALYRLVGPGYFEAVGQRLLRGRTLNEADMSASSSVAVVSSRLATQLWPSGDPLGRTITLYRQRPGRSDYGQDLEVQVVGVVADAVFQYPGGPAMGAVFFPFSIAPTDQASLMVRARHDPSMLVAGVRAAMLRAEQDLPTSRVRPLMQGTWQSLVRRFDLVLLAFFATTALALAAIGLYGVVAYLVAQRRREIGIRRAIGATDGQLRRSFVAFGLRISGLGILLGVPLAAVGGRLLRANVFGVGIVDLWTLAAAALFLLVVAAVATYVPTRRLSEISPLEALRAE